MVFGPFDHVENDQDRLVGRRRLAEKAANRGVVELLLGQDGDQNVGRVADQPGPVPVHGNRAIHIGCIQQHEVGRLKTGGILAIDQPVGWPFGDRIIFRGPGAQLKTRKNLRQVMTLRKTLWQEANRMSRLGRVGMNPAGREADQVIEHGALADVGPTRTATIR